MFSVLQRDDGSAKIRGTASFEALALRSAVRLPLDELLNAIDAARWPAAPRESLILRLSRGDSIAARTLRSDEAQVEIDIGGERVHLPADPRWPPAGRSFDLALQLPVRQAATGSAGPAPSNTLASAAEPTGSVAGAAGPTSVAQTDAHHLSSLALHLDRVVLRAASVAASGREVASASPTRALLPAPPEDAATLASALRRETAQSGLFYEAHLARWTRGAYQTPALREEPQARIAPPDGGTTWPVDPGAWPDELAALVARQLETLDGGVIRGQMLPWPEQTCAWELWQEKEQESRKTADGAPAWGARLRLELPRLGAVTAYIRLSTRDAHGPEARLRLEASGDAAAVLREARAHCADALRARGIASAMIEVSEHGRR